MWIIKKANNELETAEMYRNMYLKAAHTLVHDFMRTDAKGNTFIPIWNAQRNTFENTMQHLACFAPGMLALGYYYNVSADPLEHEAHLRTAEALGDTCLKMYTKYNIAPKAVRLGSNGMQISSSQNFQRPETSESMYILWKVTIDQKWREGGFDSFSKVYDESEGSWGFCVFG